MGQLIWDWVVKVAPSLWPVITLLIGVYVGGRVTSKNQRKYWILDNKRSEYRKLLTTLTLTFHELVRISGYVHALSPKEQRKMADIETEAYTVIRDRLFIAKEVKEMELLKRWGDATEAFKKDHDADQFGISFWSMAKKVRESFLAIIDD